MAGVSGAHFGRAKTDDIAPWGVTLGPGVACALRPRIGHTRHTTRIAGRAKQMDDHRTKGPTEGFRDDQGTRVGAPDQSAPRQHSDAPSDRPERHTGAGSEASEGVHNARGGAERREEDATGLSSQETGHSTREGSQRAGSEPLPEKGKQHRSGYGGAGGRPVTSSDDRQDPRRQ
ncbi:MAG TPA: hypothetical protein VF461_22000 [Gemmatimonadaceae bacterium]